MPISAKATQDFVPIKEVRDGIVILKDGSLRRVILVTSVNLFLKSNDEQKATIYQFQSFLNTLDFPAQIVVQSRRLDIRPYLLVLEERMGLQSEPLLKLQTREYIEFVRNFTEQVAIMTKSFFVVVPYTHVTLKTETGILSKFFPRKDDKIAREAARLDFEEQRSQLEQRTAVVQDGLARCGIKSVPLGTEEVVEMFYKIFNPGELEGKIQI
jgi:type IV secretory pathway VirB4 component